MIEGKVKASSDMLQHKVEGYIKRIYNHALLIEVTTCHKQDEFMVDSLLNRLIVKKSDAIICQEE